MHDACPIVKNGTILREASCRVFPSAVLSVLLVALTADTHCHSHCALLCNCALVALSLHSLFSSLALSCSGRLGNLSRFLCYPLAHCSISTLLLVSTGIQISKIRQHSLPLHNNFFQPHTSLAGRYCIPLPTFAYEPPAVPCIPRSLPS